MEWIGFVLMPLLTLLLIFLQQAYLHDLMHDAVEDEKTTAWAKEVIHEWREERYGMNQEQERPEVAEAREALKEAEDSGEVKDAYQEYLKEKRHRDQVVAKTKGPIIFGQPQPSGEATPTQADQATERFLAAVATLPHVEQYVVMAYYGLNFPRQNVKAIRARIKETKGQAISGAEVSARRQRATWFIAGALTADPKEVQKVLDDHRDRLLEIEKRTPREHEEVAQMQEKELAEEADSGDDNVQGEGVPA